MLEHGHGEERFGAAPQAAEWDARYNEPDGALWSGRPNGRLAAEVADLEPGRALDIGCGEGADAIYHDLDHEHREHMKSRGIDPADYVVADDLGRLLGNDFRVELRTVEPRLDP